MGNFKSLIEGQQQEINNLIKYLNENLVNLNGTSLELLNFDEAFDLSHILNNKLRLVVDLEIVCIF